MRIRTWLLGAAVALVVAVGLWHLAALAYVIGARLTYPMDIEWMEGATLYHSVRTLRGEPVYGPPSQGFLPFPYPPFHNVVLAAAGMLVGIDYWSGRLLSALSFALYCGAIGLEVWRHARTTDERVPVTLAAVASICAAFPVVGGWYDLVRVDTLAMALVAIGAVCISGDSPPSVRRTLVASVALTCALYTKQTTAFHVAFVALYAVVRFPRRGLHLGAAVLGLSLLAFSIAQAGTGGWFLYWLFAMQDQPTQWERLEEGLRHVAGFAPFIVALPVLVVALAWLRWLSARASLWCGLLGAGFAAGLLPFMSPAGYVNNLMPIVMAAGPAAALVYLDLVRGLGRARTRAAFATRVVVLLLAALWLAARRYDLVPFVPDSSRRASAAALNEYVRNLDGGVIIPNFPFLPVRNGHSTPQLHTMTYNDSRLARREGLDLSTYLERSDARYALMSGGEGIVVEHVRRVFPRRRQIAVDATSMTGFITGLFFLHERRDRADRRTVFDFEWTGWPSGWEVRGTAFEAGPTTAVRENQQVIMGLEGARVANSYHPYIGDDTVGTLVSPPFRIDRPVMGVLVGGGATRATRVELRVGSQVVNVAVGGGDEDLREERWEVATWMGRVGRLVIVDEARGPRGHVLVDDVTLFGWADAGRSAP